MKEISKTYNPNEVEQKLADDFEYAEVHHFGFVVIELRKAMVNFRPGVNLKFFGMRLPGRNLQPWHV